MRVMKVATGDLDGDGQLEVAAATATGAGTAGVHAIDSDGSSLWHWDSNFSDEFGGSAVRDLVVIDVNGDGVDDVVAISDDHFVYALSTRPEIQRCRGRPTAACHPGQGPGRRPPR